MTGPLKWHGGKHYLASKIIALLPDRKRWHHYVEPFFGGGSVLFANDPEGLSEVVNDLNDKLTNFWYCLSERIAFKHFRRRLEGIPFCESMWRAAQRWLERPCDDPGNVCVTCGTALFVVCRQSLAGRMESFAPLSKARLRRGMNEQASAWLSAVEGLPAVHDRLKRVIIVGPKPAIDVIRQQDSPHTVFYCDPPYLSTTRAAPEVYAHEMTDSDHFDLLFELSEINGRFLLSGYRSPMYDAAAERFGWRRHDFTLPNHSAGGGSKRKMVESVWTNY